MKEKLHEYVQKLKELSTDLGRTPTSREFIATGVSGRVITSCGGYNELVRLCGLDFNTSKYTNLPAPIIGRPPKVLIFDLEVAPAIAYTYNFREAFIHPENIIQMPYILAYSAKWLGFDEIYYGDTRNTPRSDKKLLESLSKLLKEADYACGHNMKRYDLPTTRGRMIIEEMLPVKKIEIIDTLKIALRHFKFPFYKLGELAKYLKCDLKKLSHAKFPGSSLFTEADKGNQEAFIEMEEYCKMDTLVTEEILKKLMPWEPSVNFQMIEQKIICSCGAEKFIKDGLYYTNSGAKQRFVCTKCGKLMTHKENLIDNKIRKELLK